MKKVYKNEDCNIKSILDIGCGGGVLMKLVNKNVKYLGVDADAGIYKRKKHKNLKYFRNAAQTESYLSKINKKYDCVVLMDVLEHTDTFLKLFYLALKKSNKYVLVGLPNEDYIMSRLRFMFGKGLMTHGLEMINTNKPINEPSAELCEFIIDKLGISQSALELGIKRSLLENSPLPIVMWSYGLLTLPQLKKVLSFQR